MHGREISAVSQQLRKPSAVCAGAVLQPCRGTSCGAGAVAKHTPAGEDPFTFIKPLLCGVMWLAAARAGICCLLCSVVVLNAVVCCPADVARPAERKGAGWAARQHRAGCAALSGACTGHVAASCTHSLTGHGCIGYLHHAALLWSAARWSTPCAVERCRLLMMLRCHPAVVCGPGQCGRAARRRPDPVSRRCWARPRAGPALLPVRLSSLCT